MTDYSRGTAYAYVTCTPTGDDTNGGVWGGQQSGNGVDRSLDDDAHVDIDGTTITAEITGRTTLTLDGWTVSTDDCGNGVRLYSAASGSNWVTGPISSVDTSANTWTIPSQHGPWNGASGYVTGKMGGACATPGEAASRTAADGGCYVRAGTYTLTSNASDEPGGRPALISGTIMCAFKDTPGDHLANPDDRVILLRGSTTDNGAMIVDAGSHMEAVVGFDIDCDDEWTQATNMSVAVNCIARNATGDGYECDQAYMCSAHDCGGYGFYYGKQVECAAYDCADGFITYMAFRCLAHGCAGRGFYAGSTSGVSFCVADNCGDGYYTKPTRACSTFNMATNCTVGGEGSMPGLAVAYNNTANWENMSEIPTGIAARLQLTADPYEDAGSNDFRINDTAGGGAELENFAPKWGASGLSGPQEQFAAILKSSGGGSTVFPSFPINAGT